MSSSCDNQIIKDMLQKDAEKLQIQFRTSHIVEIAFSLLGFCWRLLVYISPSRRFFFCIILFHDNWIPVPLLSRKIRDFTLLGFHHQSRQEGRSGMPGKSCICHEKSGVRRRCEIMRLNTARNRDFCSLVLAQEVACAAFWNLTHLFLQVFLFFDICGI